MPNETGDKPKKKKIGWWRTLARWFGLPMLEAGKAAAKEAIPPEQQPLENFAVLSIDTARDIIEIYTDLNPENKKQINEWWAEKQGDVINILLELVAYAIPKIMAKKANGDTLTSTEKKALRIFEATK